MRVSRFAPEGRVETIKKRKLSEGRKKAAWAWFVNGSEDDNGSMNERRADKRYEIILNVRGWYIHLLLIYWRKKKKKEKQSWHDWHQDASCNINSRRDCLSPNIYICHCIKQVITGRSRDLAKPLWGYMLESKDTRKILICQTRSPRIPKPLVHIFMFHIKHFLPLKLTVRSVSISRTYVRITWYVPMLVA